MQFTTRRVESGGSSRRGSSLVLALLSVFVIGGLGMAFLQISVSVSRRQHHSVETTSAFYVSEAGLAEAFQAVRVGRTGQIGSETKPARFGQGLVWVNASETADHQVRLESTALVGAARASLALIVEPVELALGFFSDEDLVIDQVLLMDGYDAAEGTHSSAVEVVKDQLTYSSTGHEQLMAMMNEVLASREELLLAKRCYCDDDCDICPDPAVVQRELDAIAAELDSLSDQIEDFEPGEEHGFDAEVDSGRLAELARAAAEGGLDHTLSGGLLASNGNVVLGSEDGAPVEIFGEVISGPGGSVETLAGSQVQGQTEQRSSAIELPSVEVPTVAMAAAVVHADVLPMIVGAGTHGYESVVVGAGSDLVISGPATVVMGELLLEPDARLVLDTRGGDVALFLTGGMDLQPGSFLETSGEVPDESSILVSSDTRSGSKPVLLDAASSFHGVVYAPETEVYIGSDFEVFGSVVARKLTIGAGAKLHFDHSGVGDSPIPRIVSWKLIEVPAVVRNSSGDLYELLGISRSEVADLSEAHDLEAVELSVEFLDQGGNLRKYSGLEESFDWAVVAEVVAVDRDPTRTQEEGAEAPREGPDPATEDPVRTARPEVGAQIAVLQGSELKDYLYSVRPLADREIKATLDREVLGPGKTKDVLLFSGDLSNYILKEIITQPTELNSKELKDVLQSNSPLPPEILELVKTNLSSLLDDSHVADVLGVN